MVGFGSIGVPRLELGGLGFGCVLLVGPYQGALAGGCVMGSTRLDRVSGGYGARWKKKKRLVWPRITNL